MIHAFSILEEGVLLGWFCLDRFILHQPLKFLVICKSNVVAESLEFGEWRAVIHEEFPLRRDLRYVFIRHEKKLIIESKIWETEFDHIRLDVLTIEGISGFFSDELPKNVITLVPLIDVWVENHELLGERELLLLLLLGLSFCSSS